MTTINKATKAIKTAKTAKPAKGEKITGVKTKAEQAAILAKAEAKPKGGKPGSAMASQSAQYSKPETKRVNPDIITTSQSLASGGKAGDYVVSNGKDNIHILNTMRGEIRKLAVVGGSMKAVREYIATHKPDAKLANGVTARLAPNAALAVSRAKSKEEPAPKVGRNVAQPVKAPEQPKAEKAPKAPVAPRAVGDRSYSATKKEDNSKPGSFRTYMIGTIRAHTSTEAAKAFHAKSGQFAKERLNFKWAHDNGYIVLK